MRKGRRHTGEAKVFWTVPQVSARMAGGLNVVLPIHPSIQRSSELQRAGDSYSPPLTVRGGAPGVDQFMPLAQLLPSSPTILGRWVNTQTSFSGSTLEMTRVLERCEPLMVDKPKYRNKC